ncbi:uncharacterized protein LOC130772044 [Actinidia eriantha]|uniref:uncharacterized protein LOC130772044 n=1 Tax=Actinidia eriantha TaxID=165200 RepID=UPI00258FAB04|nr:uncharacterized protein LOC130772044 [Actinidia eriantha]
MATTTTFGKFVFFFLILLILFVGHESCNENGSSEEREGYFGNFEISKSRADDVSRGRKASAPVCKQRECSGALWWCCFSTGPVFCTFNLTYCNANCPSPPRMAKLSGHVLH